MLTNRIAKLLSVLLLLTLASACGGGGGGGNDDSSSPPETINLGQFYDGDLSSKNSETWSFSAAANTFISVELYGARLDQTSWNTPLNAPIVKLLNSNGSTILAHNITDSAGDLTSYWYFGYRDTEIPLYYLTDAGDYSIEVSKKTTNSGAPYKIRVNNENKSILAQFGSAQEETEPRGLGTNNILASAETILRDGPGTDEIIFGLFEDDDPDTYAIDIAADTTTPAVISCFEIISQRLGILTPQTGQSYPDLELTLYDTTDTKVNFVDDFYFTDPKVCRKITNTDTANDTYKIQVTETTGASNPTTDAYYFLKYTEEKILN